MTRGERPDPQIGSLADGGGHAQRQLKKLIDDCWHHRPAQRPSFPDVVVRVKAIRRAQRRAGADDVERGEASVGGGSSGSVKKPRGSPRGSKKSNPLRAAGGEESQLENVLEGAE